MVIDNRLARCSLRATGVVVLSLLKALCTLTILSALSILITLSILSILTVLSILRLLALAILLTLTTRFVAQTLFLQVCSLLHSPLGILNLFKNTTANQHQDENNEKKNK